MKNERAVKTEIKKFLTEWGAWWYMPVPTGFGVQGVPDFVGVYRGFSFFVEAKFGKGVLSEWQKKQHYELQVAGAKVWVVNDKNIEEFKAEFSAWTQLSRAKAQLGA